ncbi:MAG: hypothetical protein AB9834_13465 [Lentimicrobium sp.]
MRQMFHYPKFETMVYGKRSKRACLLAGIGFLTVYTEMIKGM